MNTKEMLLKLIEKPYKEFYSHGINRNITAKIDGGTLIFMSQDGEFIEHISLTREWIEINKSVTWQEAFQHWLEGGGFAVEVNGRRYTNNSHYVLGGFDEHMGVDGFDREQLKKGKFYLI